MKHIITFGEGFAFLPLSRSGCHIVQSADAQFHAWWSASVHRAAEGLW